MWEFRHLQVKLRKTDQQRADMDYCLNGKNRIV